MSIPFIASKRSAVILTIRAIAILPHEPGSRARAYASSGSERRSARVRLSSCFTRSPGLLNVAPHALRRERHLHHVHGELRLAQRIVDRRRDRGHRTRYARFTRSLCPERIERRRCLLMMDLEARHVDRGRDRIVHEGRGEELPGIVVDEMLVEGAAERLSERAMQV